ncbi:MAG: beta-ketoacyl-[acyl-carrier-protein] synthase family protein [Pseudomonadota bacterium]|nr:beta-ketoacyl-[acyl-carrier-protein] synthase family protein [Pseudomonadota bacterium]
MKIVISGIGIISAAGFNLEQNLEAIKNGKRNGAPVSIFSTILPYPVFEVKSLPEKYAKEGMRTRSLAFAALKEALDDAGLQAPLSGFRTGVCLGTTVASQLNDISFYTEFRKSGSADLKPVDLFLKGNLAESVACSLNASGPSITVVNACSSGTDAIGIALSWLKAGFCDIAIAGGADEINRVPLCGFGSLGILSNSLCAPFDKNRSGLNLGEGAGILIIEREDFYIKRCGKPSLYLSGYGSFADAYHLTAPRPDGTGLESAIRKALSDAKVVPEDICFVNAHGTGTLDNDRVEGSVLSRVFGDKIKFLSTKGYTGHTLGGAGSIEAVYTAAALKEGWIPSNAGFECKDDDIPITPVTANTPINGCFAVSTSLAFGGNNAAIVIERA